MRAQHLSNLVVGRIQFCAVVRWITEDRDLDQDGFRSRKLRIDFVFSRVAGG